MNIEVIEHGPEISYAVYCLETLRFINEHATPLLSQTPCASRRLLPLLEFQQDRGSVHTIILGGVPVRIGELSGLLGLPPDSKPRIWNLYGITEATVQASVRELT